MNSLFWAAVRKNLHYGHIFSLRAHVGHNLCKLVHLAKLTEKYVSDSPENSMLHKEVKNCYLEVPFDIRSHCVPLHMEILTQRTALSVKKTTPNSCHNEHLLDKPIS
jgi:hypothetical protein